MANPLNIDIDFGKRVARAEFSSIVGQKKHVYKGDLFVTTLKKDRKRAFYRLKNTLEFPELCQAADYIDKNVHKMFREQLYGNPLPRSYKELGKCEFTYVADNLISEINWILVGVRKYSYQVNLFLAYKKIYDENLLVGSYDEAEKYLDKIENEICFSLWSLENRFLLKECRGESAGNKDFLSQFNNENQSDSYTKSLAHYLSLRAEKALSVNRFTSDLEMALSKLTGKGREEHIEYYLFKLSFLNHIKFEHYTEIVAYDFQHSIIDRYLSLRKVLTNLLTISNHKIEEVENGTEIKAYVLNRINYLIRKINDPILYKLKLFGGEKLFAAFDEQESRKQLAVIDKYTSGLYQEVETDIKDLLLNNPTQFDLYVLFIKALVYQKKSFQAVGNPKSIQNQILNEIYNIVSVNINPLQAGMNLSRIANNLASCELSYGLIDFVFFQTKGKEDRKLFARLSYNVANPIIYEIYSDSESQINYLQFLKDRFSDSLTVDFFYNQAVNSDSLVDFEKKLPEVKYKTECARAFQKKGQFSDAALTWESIIDKFGDTTPVYETSVRNLYLCYEELKNFDDCIKLFVNSYFINPYIIDKIEVQSLLQKIKENRFKVVEACIELPLFYTITNADENETHTAFEKFNLNNEVCKPSELLSKFDQFNYDKILFYLKYSCGPEILKHSIHINGTRERLEERLSISRFLQEKDQEDKDFYEDEIKYISNILIIQKGLLELDESKIYVNEQGIINNELKEYEAVFQRFKTISGIADKGKVLLLDRRKGRLTTVNYSEEYAKAEKIEYSSNPVFDIYKELFDAIKEKFLHSKFGIVAYLSTRIRHGVLLGEIRPIFEKHKLITQKEGETSTYKKNFIWETNYRSESVVTQAKIQMLLKDFSYAIDGLIFDLIKKYLQVFDEEKNKDGWFDYDFDDEILFWFSIRAIKTQDFTQFAKDVFEILWDKTDSNLNIIRQKIQGEIANLFNEHFDRLEKDMIELLGAPKAQMIVNEIKACSTETHTVIQRISSWFKRSGTQTSDFQLNNLIDIVIEYCNKAHPNKRINLTKEVTFSTGLKGEYYTHFADLLRIFLENIQKHADESVHAINAKIAVKETQNILVIDVENPVTNKARIEELKSLWQDKRLDVTKLVSENKSGFHKALKILRSDLKDERNEFLTSLDNEETHFTVSLLINLDELKV